MLEKSNNVFTCEPAPSFFRSDSGARACEMVYRR